MKRCLFVLLIGFNLLSFSKIPSIKIEVVEDSFLVVKPFQVSVCLVHDDDDYLSLVPSDDYQSNWEIRQKRYFETVYTTDSLYLDSAVFSLVSFEVVDSIPVFF